nr:prolyl oligopeptidase family serine peptidase [uncultured Halomonas sp.]
MSVDLRIEAAARPAEGLSELRADAAGVFWLAADPATGYRSLWRWAGGEARALTSGAIDIASRVNGYGGGSYTVIFNNVMLVEATSQALLCLDLGSGEFRGECQEPAPWWSRANCRYGGLVSDSAHRRVLAVEEQGDSREGVQRLVALREGQREVIAHGADFYGAPALSPDGCWMAWVEWSLPHMPWQRSRLCIAELDSNGRVAARRIWDAGAAVTQPCFSTAGQLIVMSDHAGWWQPWRIEGERATALTNVAADHAPAPWQLGEGHHRWDADGGVVVRFEHGAARLLRLDSQGRETAHLLPEATRVIGLAERDGWLYALTQGPAHGARLERVRGDGRQAQVLLASNPDSVPMVAELIEAPVGQGETVSAFVYRAAPDRRSSAPLIMRVHGGPTAACYPVYDPLIAWWTQQGYSVADINPRGSANFGRAYRERLAGGWGVLDVEDADALAEALIAHGIADPARLFIRGQSAGGFTVLNTLTSTRRFRAGASLYGVTDAPRLATLTHRFESGYLDWLLGDTATQRARSPRYRCAEIAAPVIFFQGELDRVVVPEQTLAMVTALKRHAIPAEAMLFADEGHGIRHPANRARMIARELAFYHQAAHDDLE